MIVATQCCKANAARSLPAGHRVCIYYSRSATFRGMRSCSRLSAPNRLVALQRKQPVGRRGVCARASVFGLCRGGGGGVHMRRFGLDQAIAIERVMLLRHPPARTVAAAATAPLATACGGRQCGRQPKTRRRAADNRLRRQRRHRPCGAKRHDCSVRVRRRARLGAEGWGGRGGDRRCISAVNETNSSHPT